MNVEGFDSRWNFDVDFDIWDKARKQLAEVCGGNQSNADKLAENLAKMTSIFNLHYPKDQFDQPGMGPQPDMKAAAAQPRVYLRHPGFYYRYPYVNVVDRSVNINIGNTYNNYHPAAPNPGINVPTGQGKKDEKDKKDNSQLYAIIAVAALALSNVITVGLTTYYWIIPSVKNGWQARKQATEFKEIAKTSEQIGNSLSGIPRANRDLACIYLGNMTEALNQIGQREKTAKTRGAIGWTMVSLATMGAVNSLVAYIGATVLQSAITATSSAFALNVYSFCWFCTSPPMLIAIVTIGIVGKLILLCNSESQNKKINSNNAHNGWVAFESFTDIISRPPAFNPAVAEQPGQAQNQTPPSTEVPEGQPAQNTSSAASAPAAGEGEPGSTAKPSAPVEGQQAYPVLV